MPAEFSTRQSMHKDASVKLRSSLGYRHKSPTQGITGIDCLNRQAEQEVVIYEQRGIQEHQVVDRVAENTHW